MEPNQQNIPSQQISPLISNKQSNLLLMIIVGIAMLILGFGGGYLLFANKSEVKLQETKQASMTSTLSPTIAQAINKNTPPIEWRVAKSIAPLTFEYPNGWHVGGFWPEKWENGVSVWIDTEPVSNSPRGGPFAKIEMNWKNGIPNAEEVFNKTKEDIKKNTDNVKEEIIKSDNGDIFHYTGILPEGYMGGATLDEYVVFINNSDNMNDIVVTLDSFNNPDLKDILRHIVLSFKKN